MEIRISIPEYNFGQLTTKQLFLEPLGSNQNKVELSITDREGNKSISIEIEISVLQKALSKLAL